MKLYILVIVACLFASTALSETGHPQNHIHAYGYGPVKIGMTPDEASKHLGIPLAGRGDLDTRECYYLYPDGDSPAMGYMVQDEQIVRIDVWGEGVTTLSGLAVGSKEEDIQPNFKSEVFVEEHEYLGAGGHYVTVQVHGGNHLLFETTAMQQTPTPDGGLKSEDFRVTKYRIGKPSAVTLLEGCL